MKNNENLSKLDEKQEKNTKKQQNNVNLDKKAQKSSQKEEKKKMSKGKKAIVGLSIATAIFAMSSIGLGIGLGISIDESENYKASLENVYQSNFYSLLDNVNNLENKLSKTLASSSSTYARKSLLEVSKNASEAEIALASLPLSSQTSTELGRLVNQISGYTSSLAESLAEGDEISEDDTQTLQDVYENVVALKDELNDFARLLNKGYSILNESMNGVLDGNSFSQTLSSLKTVDVDYPTMIYDGPFSDSVVNSVIKGLSGDEISKADGESVISNKIPNATDISFDSKTTGRFECFNYLVTTSSGQTLYTQITIKGGNILTISGSGSEGNETISEDDAQNLAIKFASNNGIENPKVVWTDRIDNDYYLNIAPTENGIILYPDLVKVKVDLAGGTIVGYDSTSYFTNHVSRTLSEAQITIDDAKALVPEDFEVEWARKVLSPLEYNREVECIEVKCNKNDEDYYFYYNSQDGTLENILKVIKTDNGSLLM